jgi:hypothetical protein
MNVRKALVRKYIYQGWGTDTSVKFFQETLSMFQIIRVKFWASTVTDSLLNNVFTFRNARTRL